MATNLLDVLAKWEAPRNWFMPRIEPSPRYCIKGQTSKPPFVSAKGAATYFTEKKHVIIWRSTEAGFRTKHATVRDPYNGKHEI